MEEITEEKGRKKSIKDMKLKDVFNTRGKRGAGYVLLIIFEVYLFALFFTCAMEYYVTDVSEGFFSYFISDYLTYLYDVPKFLIVLPRAVSEFFFRSYEVTVVMILLLFVFFVFQRGYIAVLTSGTLGMILCYASKIKFQNRMELLNYRDMALTEAAGMAKEYLSFDFGLRFLGMLIIVLVFGALTFFSDRLVRDDRKAMVRKEKVIFWGIRAGIGLLMIGAFFHYQYRVNKKIKTTDYLDSFFYLTERPSDFVVYRFFEDKSTTYKVEEVREAYQNILASRPAQNGKSTLAAEDYPNVIVIMDESWWDMGQIDPDKMKLSQDPLGPVKELGDKVSIGTAGVNIYGGGTICSEVEFLTGWNSKYFSSSSTAMAEMAERDAHSVVEYFNVLGYDTHAIHPYYGEFYSRDTLYQRLGFDHLTFDPDMRYKKLFDRYISDDALADQIIYEFENRSEDKAFIFAVSIASHRTTLEYDIPFNYDYPYMVTYEKGKDWAPIEEWPDTEYEYLTHCINGVYEASAAYAKLVSYFEEQGEPVILVMFGDHCPNLTASELSDLGIIREAVTPDWNPTAINAESSAQDVQDILTMYSVPVISWSNCLDSPALDMSLNNVSVLATRIIEKSGLPTARMALLEEFYESRLASDCLFFMLDEKGGIVSEITDEIRESIQNKIMIQYDQIYGDDICKDIWLPMNDR